SASGILPEAHVDLLHFFERAAAGCDDGGLRPTKPATELRVGETTFQPRSHVSEVRVAQLRHPRRLLIHAALARQRKGGVERLSHIHSSVPPRRAALLPGVVRRVATVMLGEVPACLILAPPSLLPELMLKERLGHRL